MVRTSKNYYVFFSFLTAGIGFIIGSLMYIFRHYLALLYTGSSDILSGWLCKLIFVYFLISWAEQPINTVMLGLKSLGRLNLLIILNIGFGLVLNIILGYIVYRFEGDCSLQFANFMLCTMMSTIASFAVSLSSDWSVIKKEDIEE